MQVTAKIYNKKGVETETFSVKTDKKKNRIKMFLSNF
jgi:hypothetical protein